MEEVRRDYWMSLIFENQKWEMQNEEEKNNHWNQKEIIRCLPVTCSWAGFKVYLILFCICDGFSDQLIIVLVGDRSVCFEGES